MKNSDINGEKLSAVKKLYATSRVAKAAFDYFATCQRNRSATKVNRLLSVLWARGQDVSYADVRDFLRELARLQCGVYVIGRRGQPSRLEWTDELVSLGQAAAGQRSEIEQLTEEEAPVENEEVEQRANGQLSPDDMRLSYPLRRDRNIEIVVPKDISSTEAQRLGDFIKTLQFE
jgi:hypothetical protein